MVDAVYQSIYDPFLEGTGFQSNYSKDRKAIISRYYLRKLASACITRFKWEGMPETVDPRFIELTLFMRGLSVFYFDDELERYLALRGAGVGIPDWHDNPIMFQVNGNQMLNKQLSADNCVPIWGNNMRVPDHDLTFITAGRLADFDMTIDQINKGARRPVLLVGDENIRSSLMAVYRQIEEGQPFIATHKSFGENLDNHVKSFDLGTKASDIAAIQIAKTRVFNEYMGFMGINNANQDKRERLVSEEVNANNSQIGIFRSDPFEARRMACKQINDKYGLSVSVDWNEESIVDVDQDIGESSINAMHRLEM